MLLSARPPARNLPSGEKATLLTAAAKVNFLISLASAAFQTNSVLSALPAATWVPAGFMATHKTPNDGPANGRSTCPLLTFHKRTCLSLQPVKRCAPSGLRTALVTWPGCASNLPPPSPPPLWERREESGCHSLTLPSADAESTCPLL